MLTVLVLTSYFAALLALHNTLSRYVMSLGGRAGGLPSLLGATHKRFKSPSNASVAVSVVTAVGVVGFAVGGADPFLQLFAWLSGLGTLASSCSRRVRPWQSSSTGDAAAKAPRGRR